MASKHFPPLAATAFAAILFNFLWKRRSNLIRAAANDARRRVAASGYGYEVFLSFRRPDTRGFTDLLYTSLVDAGICAFNDDEGLRRGEEFGPELLQAIKQSNISIPIFSKGYASSVWCLKELAQMVECKKARRQTIMPIFYDVAPSEVQYQTGVYGKAFRLHESKKRYDKKTISEWKDALKEVSLLDGWDLHSMPNRREGEFARKLTQKVFNVLKKAFLVVSDCLVNVDNHVDAIMEMIGAQTSETRIIGIHGMGGIGKTTIAKIIYNELSENFEDRCFLSDIREMSKRRGIEGLQNELISNILEQKCRDIRNIDDGIKVIKDRLSNKRVLLLLDDVHEKSHVGALVGKCDWFGKGSKLIITTRNKEVLDVPEVDGRYELMGMDLVQSLQLFSRHAFRRDYPLDEYIDQSKRAVNIAGGLPLALEVIGSLLCCTKKENWDLRLEELESVPRDEVMSKLKISYEALNCQQQYIFLDIACLFIGYDKAILIHFWDESSLFSEDAMEVLQNTSLIKITEDNKVWMHTHFRDLGREMVRRASKMQIGKQSRVWDPKEALDLLRRHEGGKKVEALRLEFDQWRQYCFTYEGFVGLSNLRFLEVDGSMENFHAEERLLWDESPTNFVQTKVFQENSDLLPLLRWLSWHKIPTTLNITNFSMEGMVILDVFESEIRHDWKGWRHIELAKNLKILNLTDCHFLERTPSFFAHVKLERLILRGCSELVEIDGSICQLKGLVSLDIRYCRRLRRLPEEFGGLVALEELQIDHTAIEKIPNLQDVRNLRIFTASFREKSYGPVEEDSIPQWIGNLSKLETLDLTSDYLTALPKDISSLLPRLQKLALDCRNLRCLPSLPSSLLSLSLNARKSFCSMDLSNLKKLSSLVIWHSAISEILGLERLENLQELELGNLRLMDKLPDLSNLNELRSLQVHDCGNLVEIQGELPQSLEGLEIYSCRSLQRLPGLSSLKRLRKFELHKCGSNSNYHNV